MNLSQQFLIVTGKYHSLENIYPKYDNFQDSDHIVTEDEDAGFEYYQHIYGAKTKTSHGNSNLSKLGSPYTLLIGDGCAIGAFIQDLILTKSKLYLPESFEWKLLQNGMFRNISIVDSLINHPEAVVDTHYISMKNIVLNY